MLPLYDQLEDVAVVLHRIVEEKKKGNIAMILRCNKCNEEIVLWSNELHLEWESNGSFERGMGPETEWFAKTCATCNHCKQQVEVVVSAYEYPMPFCLRHSFAPCLMLAQLSLGEARALLLFWRQPNKRRQAFVRWRFKRSLPS